jgi:hypothetical protein
VSGLGDARTHGTMAQAYGSRLETGQLGEGMGTPSARARGEGMGAPSARARGEGMGTPSARARGEGMGKPSSACHGSARDMCVCHGAAGAVGHGLLQGHGSAREGGQPACIGVLPGQHGSCRPVRIAFSVSNDCMRVQDPAALIACPWLLQGLPCSPAREEPLHPSACLPVTEGWPTCLKQACFPAKLLAFSWA